MALLKHNSKIDKLENTKNGIKIDNPASFVTSYTVRGVWNSMVSGSGQVMESNDH